MKKKQLKTYYATIPNMGDLLNEIIIKELFGYTIIRNRPSSSELSCIGSGLGAFMRNSEIYPKWYTLLLRSASLLVNYPNKVWGTGFIFNEKNDSKFFRNMEFYAVRGELTKKRIEKIEGRKINIPTADAAILAPLLFDKPIKKKYKLGIVPHMLEQDHETFYRINQTFKDSKIINLRKDPMTVVREIAECEFILSSSLHGLIIADSFGIPNKWVIASSAMKGDGFKFHDYYSAYDIKSTPAVINTKEHLIPTENQIIDDYKLSIDLMNKKQNQIFEAFPFHKI